MRRLTSLLSTFVCSTIVLEISAAAAVIPPTPNIRKGPAVWMGYGIMFLFFAGVVLVSIMPSKRGHQD